MSSCDKTFYRLVNIDPESFHLQGFHCNTIFRMGIPILITRYLYIETIIDKLPAILKQNTHVTLLLTNRIPHFDARPISQPIWERPVHGPVRPVLRAAAARFGPLVDGADIEFSLSHLLLSFGAIESEIYTGWGIGILHTLGSLTIAYTHGRLTVFVICTGNLRFGV